jgi:hypothetical protein
VETRFDVGTSFIIVSGAVRLRSLGDDVITLRVVDALVVRLLGIVIEEEEEEEVTNRGGEVGFFWKRLRIDIIILLIKKQRIIQSLVLTQYALFDVHHLVIIRFLEYPNAYNPTVT